MPDIGTGGGMKLSVGIGLNLTGFEALTQITKELESLQQMALKTEQSFRNMGAALRQTMNMGTSEMGRAAERMERASRSGIRVPQGAALGEQYAFGFSGVGAGLRRETINDRRLAQQQSREETSQRASRQEFLSSAMTPIAGVRSVDPEILAKSRFNLGLETQKSRAIAASTRAIQEETAARMQAWNNLKTGIMAGIGVTAAFEAANLARMGLHAVGQLDERVAAMRMTGHSEDEIERTKRGAFENPVHGVNAAERMFLGQEMAGILGKPVSDETTKGISVLARAITRITGQGDITSNTRNVLRSADSFGNLINDSGQLDEKRLLNNAMAVERGIAVTQGFVKADTFMHNSRMAMAPLQALDVANNPHALAQFAVMNEDLGDRAGDTLNSMFSESMAGISLSSDKGSMLMKHHLLNMNKIEPLMKLPGGSAKLLGFDALVGEGNFLDKLRNAHDVIAADVKAQHPNATPQQLQQLTLAEETKTFGRRAARGIEDVNSATGGQEKVAKTEERLRKLGTTIEEIDTQSQNFNDGLLAVKASFQDLAIAMVSAGGATRLLYGVADALENIAGFVEKHKAIASVLADIAGVLATFLALRGAMGGLKMLGGMFVGASAAAGAGAAGTAGLAAGAGAAEAGGLAGLGIATETAIMGLSKFNVALLAISALITTVFANKMGQQDLLNFAKNEGFKPSKKDAAPTNTGESLDQWFSKTWLGGFFKKIPSFENDQGELRTYGQMEQKKQFLEENKAIMAEGKYGKGFSGEEYPAPMKSAIATTAAPGTSTGRPTGPRRMSVTHAPNSMLPPTGPVKQTDFDSPLARGLAAQHQKQEEQKQEQFLNRYVTPRAPASLISPTGVNTPPVGATPAIPMVGSQPARSETLPSLKVSTIETNMLIVRGAGGQPQVGTNATERAATTPSNASPSTPGLAKSSNTTSATMIAGQPVIPGRPLSPDQMGAIEFSGKMGNTYPPEIMAQYNQQKGIGQNANAPSALQSVAPGEPIAGLGSMAGSTPQTGVAPGIPTHGAPSVSGIGGARPVSAGDRMAGHQTGRTPVGIHGSTATAPAFTSAQQKDAAAASVKFWMSKGLTKNQASGMAAQEIKESGGNPRAVGDGGQAHGLYQHHPDRIAAIKTGTGIDMLTADANQQREGAFWEMMHTEKGAWQGLKASSTPQEAGAAGSMLFERPADRMGEAFSRGALASRIAMDVPNIQGPQVSPEQADVPASHMTVHVHSQHMLDGDLMAENMATHFIGGGATAATSATGYDSKQHPLAPGVSVPRW